MRYNKKVRRHGLHLVAFQSAVFVLDAHVFFKQASEFEWTKIDIPDAIIDFFEANVLASTDN